MTFLSAKNCKNTSSENVRDCFSLVANLLGDVLVKKSVAVWQRRTEILRAVNLTHISPRIIAGCPRQRLSNFTDSPTSVINGSPISQVTSAKSLGVVVAVVGVSMLIKLARR